MTQRPFARLTAYRRSGYASVTVYRDGQKRRYRVGLRRYHALRNWTAHGYRGHRSGGWMRHGIEVYFWPAASGSSHREVVR